MTVAVLTMSRRELNRAEVMARIADRRMTQVAGAAQLGLSVRQVERLCRGYRAAGAASLVSRRRGRPSNRRLSSERRAEAMLLIRERYADFGPTLAHEKLSELHGIRVSVETLRHWMIEDGLWLPHSRREGRVHQPRVRRACRGELVQIDGCDHEWFEARAPRCVLLVYVDDATGELMELRFVESESTFDYFASTRQYIEQHGKPVAFYSDKAAIFRVNAKEPMGGDGMTQFARAMGELNIDVLCANTPQAKGRVERANLTLQDRLVKELRLQGITGMEAGNRWLPGFREDFNRRFARTARSAHDAHRPLQPTESLEGVLICKEKRKLSRNLTMHYKGVLHLVEPTDEASVLRGKTVTVLENQDGSLRVHHGGRDFPARPFNEHGGVTQQDVADNKYLGKILDQIRVKQIERDTQKLGEHWHSLREKKRLAASIESRSQPDISTLE